MKRIIILIAITVFSVIIANAQKSANYVSLAQSSNDTIQYLNNNFISQKAKYINQPLSKIFNDLEVKILDVSTIRRSAPGTTGIDARYFKGIVLTFINIDEYLNKTSDQRKFTKIFSLIIYTKDLLLRSDYKPLIYSEPETIDTDVKALFSGSNYLVGDLEVSPYYNTPQSGTFYKNDCGDHGIGSAIKITIPAGTYFSVYSQEDADAKAQKAGQDNANLKGTCN